MAEPMSLGDMMQHFAHFAESERIAGNRAVKQGRMADAARHADRMEAAQNQRMLIGDPEARDPHFMYDNQALIYAAQHHGRVKDGLDKDSDDSGCD